MTAYESLKGLSFPGCPEAGCDDQDPAKGVCAPCREAFGVTGVTIVVPWPRVPVVTPGGKPSKAKDAGRLIPWLSANVVNNLPKPVYRSHVTRWREAGQRAVGTCPECDGFLGHPPNEECWYVDLGRCPYFLGTGDKVCTFGCYDEPQCQTCQPSAGWPSEKALTGPVEVLVKLYKATSHEMDPLAVLEGLKPVVDGLEASGLLVNDRLLVGGWAEALKAGSRDQCRVEVTLLAVAP